VPAQVLRLVRSLTLRQVVTTYLDEWVGGLLRSIPGFLGCTLRWAYYRLAFARLDGFCFIAAGARLTHTYGIRVGRNLHLNGGAFFDGRGGLTLGNNVLVGPNAVILSSQHHWDDPTLPIVLQGHRLAATTIGDDVWIGANAVITPGVTVATGTVVGAGAVVTTDTEPYSIVAGVPARAIGSRPRPAPRVLSASA
jgi:acetyltransferase-like isoleucine patch superfamily enzyme